MPFYEYECKSCRQIFSELRSSAEMNDPIDCPECGASETEKVLSGFAVGSSQPAPAMPCGASDPSACGGGSCPMS